MTPFDPAQSVPPQGEQTDNRVDEASRARRSGSQKRERSKKLEIALTPDESADVKARAMKAGLSASSWGYALIFGNPGPRARRTPHIHAEALARATAALNKLGSNFNQIAHALNAASSLGMGQKYAEALDEVRLTLRAMREAVGRTEHSNDNQGE